MAIINSVFMGDARKSAGNGTFRIVRGRTIVSQKVSKRGTLSGDLSINQFALAVISRFASTHAADIDASFDPTTYGSTRNAFFKLNYAPMKAAITDLYNASLLPGAAKIPSDAEINQAIATYAAANPMSIYRVKKAGQPVEYLTGEWVETVAPFVVSSISVKGSVMSEGGDDVLLNTGDSIVVNFSEAPSNAVTISAVTAATNKLDAAVSTLTGDAFATLSSSTGSAYTYTVASGANGRYLRELSLNGKKILTLEASGGGTMS